MVAANVGHASVIGLALKLACLHDWGVAIRAGKFALRTRADVVNGPGIPDRQGIGKVRAGKGGVRACGAHHQLRPWSLRGHMRMFGQHRQGIKGGGGARQFCRVTQQAVKPVGHKAQRIRPRYFPPVIGVDGGLAYGRCGHIQASVLIRHTHGTHAVMREYFIHAVLLFLPKAR